MKLEGIRVLDLSNFMHGQHPTMMMADHGTELIRIEPPGGEPNRDIGKKYKDGTSVYFSGTHRGKKSIMLDFKMPGAVDAFLRLWRNKPMWYWNRFVPVLAFRAEYGCGRRVIVLASIPPARTHHLLTERNPRPWYV